MERVEQYVWKPELGVNKPQETYSVQKQDCQGRQS